MSDPCWSSVVAWLLEPSNPCVRWRTLRELLGLPDSDPEVRKAAKAAEEWPPIRRVLAMLADPATFDWPADIRLTAAEPGRDLARLATIGVPPGRPEIPRAAQRLKTRLPDNRSSDCYLPQMVAAMARYGDPADPDLTGLVARVISNETLADGNRPPTGGGGSCCISHSCHNAVVRALDCVVSVPEARRPASAQGFLEAGAAYLRSHRLFQENHHGFRPIRSEYLRLHQPWALDWLTDVMDALDVATRTGLADDPAVVPALRFVVSKRLPDGRWPLEEARVTNRPLIASLLTDIEEAGQPGKWVTLTAMLLLRRCAAMVERIEAGEEFPGPPIAAPDGSFVPYPGDDGPADEERTRNEWAALPGMAAALDALVAFAGRQGLRTGWYRGLAIGPEDCREWCCAHAKLVPARTMRAAFPVARIGFIAPRGMFTVKGIGERLGGGPLHSLPTPVRPGSWVEKALWRVRVERWTPCWDAIGIAIRDKDELAPTLAIMADAVAAFRIVQGKQAAKTGENAR